MGEFAKIFYQQFFMRDVLGKVAPGIIALCAFLWGVIGLDIRTIFSSTEGLPLAALYVAMIPCGFMVGLGLQIFGELIGFHSPSPRAAGLWLLTSKTRADTFDQHRNRLSSINTAISDPAVRADVKTQRERFVVLKEASGNFGLAIGVALMSSWYRWGLCPAKPLSWLLIAMFLAVIIMFVSHRIHAARQAAFEIRVLENVTGQQPQAVQSVNQMWDLIPSWTGERRRSI